MQIGSLIITIPLSVQSLKEKRKIVKSVVERIRSRFNASAAELAAQDSKLLAIIGISVIANEGPFLDQQLDKITDFLQQDGRFYISQIHRETFYSDFELPRL